MRAHVNPVSAPNAYSVSSPAAQGGVSDAVTCVVKAGSGQAVQRKELPRPKPRCSPPTWAWPAGSSSIRRRSCSSCLLAAVLTRREGVKPIREVRLAVGLGAVVGRAGLASFLRGGAAAGLAAERTRDCDGAVNRWLRPSNNPFSCPLLAALSCSGERAKDPGTTASPPAAAAANPHVSSSLSPTLPNFFFSALKALCRKNICFSLEILSFISSHALPETALVSSPIFFNFLLLSLAALSNPGTGGAVAATDSFFTDVALPLLMKK